VTNVLCKITAFIEAVLSLIKPASTSKHGGLQIANCRRAIVISGGKYRLP
jgi:hypothetical protein